MASIIEQTGKDDFELHHRGNRMLLMRKADHWEMWTDNASTRAWNGGLPSVKVFRSLVEVEEKYKAWKGVSQLVEETPEHIRN